MFACLYVPDFPVQAALLSEPTDNRENLWHTPVVVLDGPANLPKVVSLNDAARSQGMAVGMTKLQVEVCSTVAVRKRSSNDEDAAQNALLDCADSFSPRVESTCPGTVILDLTGTEKLFGSLQNIACKIAVHAKQMGFHLRIAVAANPDTALLAAKGFKGITIIHAGDEAKTLAPLHVKILSPSPEVLETLESWGIRTCKALGALPSVALIERLGQQGFALQQLAQGRTARPLLPVQPLPEFISSYEFDDPVDTLECMSFVLNSLLKQVFEQLIARSLATNEVRLTLDLEVQQILNGKQGEKYEHDWKLPVPTQDRNLVLTLIRLDLERITFVAPIKKLTIEAVPLRPRTAQANLFAPPSPEAQQLEITLSRIRGFAGDNDTQGVPCIGMGVALDTHKPDSFTVKQFSTDTKQPNQSSALPAYAFQVFRPALETSVELTAGMPHLVRLFKKYLRVLKASGPWCSSGSWWNGKVWSREEWDVALKTFEGIGYYRIYLDRIRNQWFIEGLFG